MQEPGALSLEEVARTLGVSQRHVARLIARKELPSLRIGRRRLVRDESLSAWLAGKEAAEGEQI